MMVGSNEDRSRRTGIYWALGGLDMDMAEDELIKNLHATLTGEKDGKTALQNLLKENAPKK
jgi:hypothetical protein